MTTFLYTHQACLEHDPGSHHPGIAGTAARRARGAVGAGIRRARARARRRTPSSTMSRASIRGRFIERSSARCPAAGHAAIDADTVLSPRSGEAALRAAGRGRAPRSMRSSPAKPTTPSAPCARPAITPSPTGRWASACSTTSPIGALRARAGARARARRRRRFRRPSRQRHAGGFERDAAPVLRLDASVSALSRHRRARARPGSATSSTCRCARCRARAEFRRGDERRILPALDAFRARPLLISAGFDAHRSDPLAQLSSTRRITPG